MCMDRGTKIYMKTTFVITLSINKKTLVITNENTII